MIVFKWEKYDTYSTIYLKEYIRNKKLKFWKWKSTILCHTVWGFKVTNIVLSEDTKRYILYTNVGIYEADEIETMCHTTPIEGSNSTWSRNG